MDTFTEDLEMIVREQSWLMNCLRLVRDLNLPDWYIMGGTIRNMVWNYMHNYPTDLHQNDIDIFYFDELDMEGKKEVISKKLLISKNKDFQWDVVNQARVHLFKIIPNRRKVVSSGESIAFCSETASCVGIRLEKDDSLTICAPHDLSDLFNLVLRSVPEPYTLIELYERRLKEKGWFEKWPKLQVAKN